MSLVRSFIGKATSAFHVEVMALRKALDLLLTHQWLEVEVETDSSLLVAAFHGLEED